MTFATMLQALEGRVPILEHRGDLGMAVKEITDDSRTVSTGSLFVAVKGERVDGHQFVPMALSTHYGILKLSLRNVLNNLIDREREIMPRCRIAFRQISWKHRTPQRVTLEDHHSFFTAQV